MYRQPAAKQVTNGEGQHKDCDYAPPNVDAAAKVRGKNTPAQQFERHDYETAAKGEQIDDWNQRILAFVVIGLAQVFGSGATVFPGAVAFTNVANVFKPHVLNGFSGQCRAPAALAVEHQFLARRKNLFVVGR